jgi:Cytochrome P460
MWAFRKSCAVMAGSTALLVLGGLRAEPPSKAATRPTYNAKGELIAPEGFRSWVFVGASLGPEYRSNPDEPPAKQGKPAHDAAPGGDFHNVYINPEAYRTYRETGAFPDPTMLVLEVFRGETRDAKGVLERGWFEGKRHGVEVAVKDKHRPGGGVPWAYYNFRLDENGKPSTPAQAKPDASCYDCHLKHASVDNVWVQFYPTLRDPE